MKKIAELSLILALCLSTTQLSAKKVSKKSYCGIKKIKKFFIDQDLVYLEKGKPVNSDIAKMIKNINKDKKQNLKHAKDFEFKSLPKLCIKHVSDEVGHGLFAGQKIKKGSVIAEYTGEIDLISNIKDTDYTWIHRRDMYKDAKGTFAVDSKKQGNETRYSNHSYCPNSKTSFIVTKDGLWAVLYVAIEDIDKGKEIYIDYGRSYWSSRAKTMVDNCPNKSKDKGKVSG